MEVAFYSTRPFEKDLRKISSIDKERIVEVINQAADSFSRDKVSFFKYAIHPSITLRGGLSSSIYILRAGRKLRVICTIEDDPLFDQRVITLLRIAKTPNEYTKVFSQIMESLYQQDLIEYGDIEDGGN